MTNTQGPTKPYVIFADGAEFHPGDFSALTKSHKRQHYIGERDGWTCAYCGKMLVCDCGPSPQEPWTVAATVDHRVAQINGGSDKLDNLVLSCRRCNSSKHSRPVELSPVRHVPSDKEVRHCAFDWVDWYLSRVPNGEDDRLTAHSVGNVLTHIQDILSGSQFPPTPWSPEEDDADE